MSMTFIQQVELTSAQFSISFTSIPQTFTDLLLVGSFRSTRSARDTPLNMIVNSSQFTARNLYGYPTDKGSQSPTNYIGWMPGANATASTFGNFQVYIPNYTSAVAKSFSVDIVQEDNQAGAFITITGGLTNSTAAVTTISFNDQANIGDFVAGSSATLYGITAGSSGGVVVS